MSTSEVLIKTMYHSQSQSTSIRGPCLTLKMKSILGTITCQINERPKGFIWFLNNLILAKTCPGSNRSWGWFEENFSPKETYWELSVVQLKGFSYMIATSSIMMHSRCSNGIFILFYSGVSPMSLYSIV